MKLLSREKIEPLIVTAASISARAVHLLFFMIIGNKYGASTVTDFVIYMIAPLTVFSAVVSGAADTVIMPVFHKSDNPNTAKYLYIYSIEKIIKFVLPLSVIIVTAYSVVAKQYDLLMMAILLPIPLVSSLSSLKVGILNASNRFRIAILGPFFGSLAAISFILLTPVNVYCFGLSFLLFEFGKMIGLYLFKDITSNGSPLRSDSGDRAIIWGIRNAKLQLVGSLVLALVYPVDVWFAATLDTGSITFVEYANKLWNIVPLFFIGHITIVYASFSKTVAIRRKSISVHKIAGRYLLFGIAVSLFLAFISNFIIRILFGFGKITIQQQSILANLLDSYLVGAGFYVGGLVYVRAMSAMGRTELLLAVACFGLLCNIIFDAFFIRIIGLNGIGLATSTVYLCIFFLLAYLYEKNKR